MRNRIKDQIIINMMEKVSNSKFSWVHKYDLMLGLSGDLSFNIFERISVDLEEDDVVYDESKQSKRGAEALIKVALEYRKKFFDDYGFFVEDLI